MYISKKQIMQDIFEKNNVEYRPDLDTIVDEIEIDTDTQFRIDRLMFLLDFIPEKPRRIIMLKYGFDDGLILSCRDVGSEYGMSGSGVSLLCVKWFSIIRLFQKEIDGKVPFKPLYDLRNYNCRLARKEGYVLRMKIINLEKLRDEILRSERFDMDIEIVIDKLDRLYTQHFEIYRRLLLLNQLGRNIKLTT